MIFQTVIFLRSDFISLFQYLETNAQYLITFYYAYFLVHVDQIYFAQIHYNKI